MFLKIPNKILYFLLLNEKEYLTVLFIPAVIRVMMHLDVGEFTHHHFNHSQILQTVKTISMGLKTFAIR